MEPSAKRPWTPAFAGVTFLLTPSPNNVIPAKAGIQILNSLLIPPMETMSQRNSEGGFETRPYALAGGTHDPQLGK